MKKVAIIIVNWNGASFLRNCLRSLFETEYPLFNVIVVDNGSIDGSSELVKQEYPQADLIELSENRGYPMGVNAGIQYAIRKYDPDYVVPLNNDTLLVQRNWLAHMVSVAETDPTIGIVNCRFILRDRTPQPMSFSLVPGLYLGGILGIRDINRREQDAAIHDVETAGGSCFLIKRSVIDTIGLLDEGYSPFLFEDVDYSLRARKANFRVTHDGQVSVVHLGSTSIRRVPSEMMQYVYRKNMIRFVRKHYPWALVFALITTFFGSPLRAIELASRKRQPSIIVPYILRDLRMTSLAIANSL